MLNFIFSKKFLIHLLLAIILSLAVAGGAYIYLVDYTEQDEIVEVPDMDGYDIVEAEAILKDIDLQGIVVDSLYLPEKWGGEVVDQEPPANQVVKKNRKIYLTIARYSAPMVKLPNIIDQTLALALAKLNASGIMVNEIIHRPSDCTDCVVAVESNGVALVPGALLDKGSKIDLVVGQGESSEKIPIPKLYGLSVHEAMKLLHMEGLNVGATPYMGCLNKNDSLAARVFKQSPSPGNETMIGRGSSVDLYFTSDLSRIPPVNIDSLKMLLK